MHALTQNVPFKCILRNSATLIDQDADQQYHHQLIYYDYQRIRSTPNWLIQLALWNWTQNQKEFSSSFEKLFVGRFEPISPIAPPPTSAAASSSSNLIQWQCVLELDLNLIQTQLASLINLDHNRTRLSLQLARIGQPDELSTLAQIELVMIPGIQLIVPPLGFSMEHHDITYQNGEFFGYFEFIRSGGEDLVFQIDYSTLYFIHIYNNVIVRFELEWNSSPCLFELVS